MAETETVVPQLPDNVLLNIFSFKTNVGSVRLVCRNFKSIFDWNIGVKWGGSWRGQLGLVHNLEEFEKFDELPCCRSFRLGSAPGSIRVVTIPKFKSKHLLKTLYVGAQVTKLSLNRTLTGLKALKTLWICNQGMTSFTSSTYLKDLINLKILHIVFMPQINFEDSLLIHFLKNAKFHNLEFFSILTAQPVRENVFCDALLLFLLEHQNTIRSLFISLMNTTKNDEDLLDILDFEIRLNELKLCKLLRLYTTYGDRFWKLGQICDQIFMQGKMLEVADECPFLKEDCLSKIIKSNVLLDVMFKQIPQDMLKNNCTTLVEIGLVIIAEDCLPLDCSVFAPCTSLKQLRLITWPNSNAEITNLIVLPPTLEKLCIFNILMKSEEVQSLAMRKPCLKNVNFGNLGTANRYGVTVASYLCFTAPEANITGCIGNSWNVPDLLESLHNRGPYHRLLALSLMETKQIKLKNTNGQQPEYAVILNPSVFKGIIDLDRNFSSDM